MKRTKIVCTIGPSSQEKEVLKKMIESGMDVARLNFSHGSYENHELLIQNIREVSNELKKPVMILQDLQGPKIRVGQLPENGLELKKGTSYIFDTAQTVYKEDGPIPVDYTELHKHVHAQERVLFADGIFEGIIDRVDGTQITITMTVSGILYSHKGLNVPDSKLTIRALTKKDKEDAVFGIQQGVDMIAASFVSSKQDILELREHIESTQKQLGIEPVTPIAILAKIERAAALDHVEEIFSSVDALMVARGDLGVETPAAQVPVVQKQLIEKALDSAKPIIVATQMLDSMVEAPRATRAEISDVANAVIDHTDAVMLSNESATGEYPVQAVKTLHDTIIATEASRYDNLLERPSDEQLIAVREHLKKHPEAQALFFLSSDIVSVRRLSRQRFELPIIVVVSDERLLRQCQLSWGIVPVFVQNPESLEAAYTQVESQLIDQHIIDPQKPILFVKSDFSCSKKEAAV